MQNKTKYLKFLCFSILCCFYACNEKENTLVLEYNFKKGENLIVLNEGNYTRSNGSLSFINLNTGEVENDVFLKVNDKNLGDVVQSLCIKGDTGFVVVNNSGKIEVIDLRNSKLLATISGFVSPRFMEIIGNKAYVTEYYSNRMYKLNLSSFSIEKQFYFKGWSEKILSNSNYLYVSSASSNTVFKMDTNGVVLDSVMLPGVGGDLIFDDNLNLWATFQQKENNQPKNSGVVKISISNFKIDQRFWFNQNGIYPKLAFSKSAKSILALSGSVFRINSLEKDTLVEPFMNANTKNWYSIATDASNQIYLGNAFDFISNGSIEKYTGDGNFIKSFGVGKIPGGLYFF